MGVLNHEQVSDVPWPPRKYDEYQNCMHFIENEFFPLSLLEFSELLQDPEKFNLWLRLK